MLKERDAKQSFSRSCLVFLTLVFLAVNGLILGWNGFSFDSVQWPLILVLDSFLLVSGLLIFFLWRRNSIDPVKVEVLDDELEMATVILDRLKKYACDEERESAGS